MNPGAYQSGKQKGQDLGQKVFIFCFSLIAELRRPKAAYRSPIPKEPMHLFSYGHLRQR